jgi:hypothetical protein
MKTQVIDQGFEPQKTQHGIAAKPNTDLFTTEPQRFGEKGNLLFSVSPAKRAVIIRNLLIIVAATLLLAGCKYPEPAKVEQLDARPAIGIAGAPEGTLLYVDGLQMGFVSQYDGKAGVLLVESGSHIVEVRNQSGETLFKTEVFLSGSATKVIPYDP